jgi:hypothetical protein
MANRTKRTLVKDSKFFATLAKGETVEKALRASGYKRVAVYEWRSADEEFRRRWEEAVDQAVELMEAEADRRTLEGAVKPVMYQGEKVGEVREYSYTLLIFRLKALRPSVYRENIRQEITGAGGGPIRHLREVSDEELEKIAKRVLKQD